MTTVTITEISVAVLATTTGATVIPATTAVEVSVAPGMAQSDADTRYARLDAANTFTLGPNVLRAGGAGIVPLKLQLAATPTADAFDILASDGTSRLDYFDSAGRLGVGPEARTTYNNGVVAWRYLVDIEDTVTAFTTAAPYGYAGLINAHLTISAANDANTEDRVQGLTFYISVSGGTKAPAAIRGIQGTIDNYDANDLPFVHAIEGFIFQYGNSVISEAYCFYADSGNFAGSGGSITKSAGLYIEDDTSDSPIGTKYGVYVGSQTSAHIGTGYAIYTNAGPVHFGDYLELPEITAPAAAAANTGRLFVRDVAGKSQLAIRFPSGSIQVIATEP